MILKKPVERLPILHCKIKVTASSAAAKPKCINKLWLVLSI